MQLQSAAGEGSSRGSSSPKLRDISPGNWREICRKRRSSSSSSFSSSSSLWNPNGSEDDDENEHEDDPHRQQVVGPFALSA